VFRACGDGMVKLTAVLVSEAVRCGELPGAR